MVPRMGSVQFLLPRNLWFQPGTRGFGMWGDEVWLRKEVLVNFLREPSGAEGGKPPWGTLKAGQSRWTILTHDFWVKPAPPLEEEPLGDQTLHRQNLHRLCP